MLVDVWLTFGTGKDYTECSVADSLEHALNAAADSAVELCPSGRTVTFATTAIEVEHSGARVPATEIRARIKGGKSLGRWCIVHTKVEVPTRDADMSAWRHLAGRYHTGPGVEGALARALLALTDPSVCTVVGVPRA